MKLKNFFNILKQRQTYGLLGKIGGLHILFFVLFYLATEQLNYYFGFYVESQAMQIQQFMADKILTVILIILLFFGIPFIIYCFIKYSILNLLGDKNLGIKKFISVNAKLALFYLLFVFGYSVFIYGLKDVVFYYVLILTVPLAVFAINFLTNLVHNKLKTSKPIRNALKGLNFKFIGKVLMMDIIFIFVSILIFGAGGKFYEEFILSGSVFTPEAAYIQMQILLVYSLIIAAIIFAYNNIVFDMIEKHKA